MNASPLPLPSPQTTGGLPLMEALARRCSRRRFSGRALDLQQLSNLLWAAWGCNRASGKRTAPSSHNRQETELYVVLPQGTYLYEAATHSLRLTHAENLMEATGSQDFVQGAALNLVLVADLSKITGKGPRETVETAYVDAGFISQNVYLFCASEGLSTVTRLLLDKAALAARLGLGPQQVITLAQTVGHPAED